MKLLIDICHPADVHLFRNFIKIMQDKGHQVVVTSRDKDVSLDLLENFHIPHMALGKPGKGIMGKSFKMIYFFLKLMWILKRYKPQILISCSSPSLAQAGFLLKIPHIIFGDTEHASWAYQLSVPISKCFISPSCFFKDFKDIHFKYNGFHELAYLQPPYFQPDSNIYDILNIRRDERFVIVRFVAWEAIHDRGEQGFLLNQKNKMIMELSKYVKVFITSEKELPDDLKQFQIKIPPEKIHDALAYTELYIGEGATMASECVCLGTPAIYINSLPLMGYLKEEQERGLLYHFNSSEGVFEKALELLNDPDLKQIHEQRCQNMLAEKIDVTAFFVWFIENYPESVEIMKKNPIEIEKQFHGASPEYQERFK